jgi:acetyltransferase-like isoleucine patch superfamily enzyme
MQPKDLCESMAHSDSIWGTLIQRSKESPHLILPGVVALLNGYFHKLKFLVQRKRIRIGKAFRLHGKLIIRGPGKIEIGDNCLIHSDIFGFTSLHTNAKESVIRIGNCVGLNGTVIQCSKEITIADQGIIANAYIIDFQGHTLSPGRYFQSIKDVPKAAIKINRNVWISAYVVINRGVEIGEGSVIGALSFVNRNVPPNCLYAGIPAEFVKNIADD